MTCTILSLFNTVTKRKRPQKPAVQVDDTEIKGMHLHTCMYCLASIHISNKVCTESCN